MADRPVVLVAGASRGLGLELARQFAERDWQVIATVRNLDGAPDLARLQTERPDRIAINRLDIADQSSVAAFKAEIGDRRLDVLYINAGIMGPRHHDPMRISDDEFQSLMLTNALAPVRFATTFLGNLREGTGVFVFMTSQLGSVARNEGGDYDLYRASKAALNTLTRSFVARLGARKLAVLSFHPGWVKTDMGGAKAPLDAETSVAGMIGIVEGARGTSGHRFLDYQGNVIPW
ncbi:SDR family oxidoreductase [Taklimakanibacter deserti]|uniref:SDR family oxidoreductase n=1 Tax=Taklimakanibacter deserti TaxID=2267839 RepID=UPI000E64D5B0